MIDDELELGGLLDRNIAGLGSAQNFVDQLGGAPEQSRDVWSIRHQSPGLDKFADAEDRWQPRAERKRYDARAIGANERVDHDVKCVGLCVPLGLERFKRRYDVLGSP